MNVPVIEPEAKSPRKSQPRRELTNRDKKLLTFLAEYGCVSAERIKCRLWQTNQPSRTHFRRIGILKRVGLIENVFGDGGISIGYRLSKKGATLLRSLPDLRHLVITRRSYKTQFNHDQLLIDIRSILETSPLVKEFCPESEIRRKIVAKESKLQHWANLPAVPDGTFRLAIPGQEHAAALELEMTLKTRSRYTRIFRHHLLNKRWSLVFYVTKNEKIQQQLMAALTELKGKDVEVQMAKRINGIYFCTLGQFLERRLETLFSNGREEISFAAIARNFSLGKL
jgi:hypothetical protein